MAINTASVTFTGAEDTLPATWTAMTGNFGIAASVTPTDGSGGVVPWITARTATGCTVNVSQRFAGTVDLVVYDKP